MTSNVLAGIETLVEGAGTALNAHDGVTATWEEYGSPSSDLHPRIYQEADDHMSAENRRVIVDPYKVPYPLQAGPTKYAPLAKKAGTAIATTLPTPQFPASAYIIATEYLEPGTVETTLTAPETLSITMMENTADREFQAAPAPHP
ncbi:putative beta-1,6-glucan biosynthesis protein (Knh1) [Aspergillus mulundensis]|uniref:Yeast cell wall synthesis Kre9/Knh1 C-terminal domain-containing protein n=1 Tax=Aspergillus mulundensis TaxID=1810919 RepID=A0A3D8SX52_9EURO|nr:Uncharacterized protein DSM5745_02661 [Aspergillus mulundensis]RDW90886.1 Uncharacterized protein DSM5745_02661 [Aspergillus mulundensis]